MNRRAFLALAAGATLPLPTGNAAAREAVEEIAPLVKRLKIVGDGVADDTEAIQEALDEAGELRLDGGKYRVTSTIYAEYCRFAWTNCHLINETGGLLLSVGDGCDGYIYGCYIENRVPS